MLFFIKYGESRKQMDWILNVHVQYGSWKVLIDGYFHLKNLTRRISGRISYNVTVLLYSIIHYTYRTWLYTADDQLQILEIHSTAPTYISHVQNELGGGRQIFIMGSGFSSSAFSTSWVVSTVSGWDCPLLKKSGLSKVVNFPGMGKRWPFFLKRKNATTAPIMASPIMTATTNPVMCPGCCGLKTAHIEKEVDD